MVQRFQAIEQIGSELRGTPRQVVALDDFNVLERDGARDRVPAECLTVTKRAQITTGKFIGDFLLYDGCPKRCIAARNCFGKGHHIGHDVPVFDAKHFAGASETTNDFVGNQKDAVAITNLAHHRHVFGRRHGDPDGDIHRVHQDRRNRFGTLALDHVFNITGAVERARRFVTAKATAIVIRGLDKAPERWKRLEHKITRA